MPKYIRTAALNAYDMSDLLKPQLAFEINLIVPDSSCFLTPYLPPALTLSIDYLSTNQVPFRLLYNLTQTIQPPSPTRSARHGKNQAANIVFVVVRSSLPVINIHEIVSGCMLQSYNIFSSTVHKDFIELITDYSAVKQSRNVLFVFNVRRSFLPLYFIIFFWSGSQFAHAGAQLVRETCGCDGGPPTSSLQNVLQIINTQNGMGSLAERIREEKRDFMGRKINVIPNRYIYGSWKSIWSHQLVPFSFRRTHMNMFYAFGGLLHSFHTVHNFTFDLIKHSVNVDVLQSPEGTIVMQTFRDCEGSVREC